MSAHGHHHHHHHHHPDLAGDRRLLWSVAANVIITVGQVVGGLFAGSLSLLADALHNFSDVISLAIAYGARRIARRPSDATMTFGYVRAEAVAALINYTTLIVIGLYLVAEAVMRFFEPREVAGWTVVVIAAIALAGNAATAALTYSMSKESMNIRAAFVHNLADALASVGVIVAGALIVLFGWHIVDPIATLVIAGYILWQAFAEIGGSIRMLMLGTPAGLDVSALIEAMRGVDGVEGVHHVHVWAIDEGENALEAHVVVADEATWPAGDPRARIRALLRDNFGIGHVTLQVERQSSACEGAAVIGHQAGGHRHETA